MAIILAALDLGRCGMKSQVDQEVPTKKPVDARHGESSRIKRACPGLESPGCPVGTERAGRRDAIVSSAKRVNCQSRKAQLLLHPSSFSMCFRLTPTALPPTREALRLARLGI